ncbi:hypothetical protein CWR43_13445 [Rhizobium sullae]|uniref:Uncharacterized protein n=1 Tax=Rhizobium sullae TaxID=50338 RepID=A0A2N0DAC5_RHISU|nr:hypothetical protein CWR43_13445 [Rhizobium sullae]
MTLERTLSHLALRPVHVSGTATSIKEAVEQMGLQERLGRAVSATSTPEIIESEFLRSVLTIEAFKDEFGISTYMMG